MFSKETKDAQSLNLIDEEICKEVLGVEPHPKLYGGGYVEGGFNWFDTVGFQIAMGKPLGSQELRNYYLNSAIWAEEVPIITKILDYLESKYYSHAFYTIHKV